MNMLTNSDVLQHMLYATSPTFVKTPSIIELIIISLTDWYSAIEDEENPVLQMSNMHLMDLANSILINLNVRLELKKYVEM